MLSPKVGFAALAILGLPVLIAAAVFGPAAFDLAFHRRPPERYVIPAGFTGWTRIDFRKPGAPRLPIEDGHLLLRLDALGRLATSSDPQLGHGKDQFFAASSTGLQPLPYVGVCKGG